MVHVLKVVIQINPNPCGYENNIHKLNIQLNTQVNSTIKLLSSPERRNEIITGIKELMNLIELMIKLIIKS